MTCPRTRIAAFKKAGLPVPPELLAEQRAYSTESAKRLRKIKKRVDFVFNYTIDLQSYHLIWGK